MGTFAFLYIIFTIIFLLLLLLWRKPRELTACIGLGLTLYSWVEAATAHLFFLLLAGAYMPVWLMAFLEIMKSEIKIQSILQRIGWKIPTLIGIFFMFFTERKNYKSKSIELETSLATKSRY